MNDKANPATPANATPSELESEFRYGIPSALAKHEHTSHVKVVLAACKLQDLLRSVPRDAAESVLLMHITTFIITDTSTGPKRATSLPETVGERLERLYPEHYVTIVTAVSKQRGANVTASLLGEPADDPLYAGTLLSSLLLWDNTTEGYEFWKALAKRE